MSRSFWKAGMSCSSPAPEVNLLRTDPWSESAASESQRTCYGQRSCQSQEQTGNPETVMSLWDYFNIKKLNDWDDTTEIENSRYEGSLRSHRGLDKRATDFPPHQSPQSDQDEFPVLRLSQKNEHRRFLRALTWKWRSTWWILASA